MKKFKQLPLERQLFFSFLFISAFVCLLALGQALWLNINRQEKTIDTAISSTAAFVASLDEVKGMLNQGYPDAAACAILDALHRSYPDIDAIAVYNSNGLRFYHTNRRETGETFIADDASQILSGSDPYIISGYSTQGEQRRAFHAVRSDDDIIGFVTVSIFNEDILGRTRALFDSFCFIMAGAFLIAVLLSRGIVAMLRSSLHGHRPEELLDLYLRQDDVLNTLTDGLIASDERGRIIFCNDAAGRMLGHDAAALRGETLGSVFPETRCAEVVQSGSGSYNRSCALGERQIFYNELPLKGEGSVHGVLSVLNDKTELRKLSDKLSGAQNMLDTLRMFNHEFMNKLHVILGYLQTGRTQEAIGLIMNSSIVSGQTIRDTADRIRVPGVCALVIGKMMHAAERGIRVVLAPYSQCRPEDLLLTEEDCVTIVGNLLENAIEALSDGEHEILDIHLSLCCQPDCNLIICRDTGSGIAPELRERIWEKGASSKGDGRGFGLYLVRQITERYHGRIELDTETGEGTCFTLTFTREEMKEE